MSTVRLDDPSPDLHPPERCSFCGADRSVGLRRSVIRATFAQGYRCVDVVDCVARSTKSRRDADELLLAERAA